MSTVEAVKGKWDFVFQEYGLPQTTGNQHIECPLCAKKQFRIDDAGGKGTWICVCGSGDGWTLLEQHTGRAFGDLAREVDAMIGNVFKPVQQEVNRTLQDNLRMWKECLPLKETMGERYLQGRGIYVLPTGGLKFSNGVYDAAMSKKCSALFGIASNDRGQPVYRHTTYFDAGRQKKLLTLQSNTGPVSIKLFQHQTILGIAEGIETALSCYQLYDLPTWSVINATTMKKFKAPMDVDHLVIFADNDLNGTGLAAAFECANKNLLSNNTVKKVTIRWTENKGDFNDLLHEECEVQSMTLIR